MRDDLIILGIAGVAAYLIIKALPAQSAGPPRVAGNVSIPPLFGSAYWEYLSDPGYLPRQAAAESAWYSRQSPVEGWTVG